MAGLAGLSGDERGAAARAIASIMRHIGALPSGYGNVVAIPLSVTDANLVKEILRRELSAGMSAVADANR